MKQIQKGILCPDDAFRFLWVICLGRGVYLELKYFDFSLPLVASLLPETKLQIGLHQLLISAT